MNTPRELHNQILKDEIDRFAARMKQVIDDNEAVMKANERLTMSLARECDRIDADQQISQ